LQSNGVGSGGVFVRFVSSQNPCALHVAVWHVSSWSHGCVASHGAPSCCVIWSASMPHPKGIANSETTASATQANEVRASIQFSRGVHAPSVMPRCERAPRRL
jgi:hypothetical protein